MTKSWPLGLRAIAARMAAIKRLVGLRAAQRLAQVRRVLLAEAHVERAGAGDADPVAAFAEIMGQRRDEAEPAAGLLDVEIARGAAGGVGRGRQRQASVRGRARSSVSGMYWSARSLSIAAERHHLDEGEVEAAAVRPFDRARAPPSSLKPLSATVLILTLSPAASAASMPVMTLSRSPQRVTARNLSGSSVSSETLIRRDAAVGEFGREARELRAVGRQRHLVERAAFKMARQAAEQRHDVAPHQRLAAGDAKLARVPSRTKAEHSRSSSSSDSTSALGQKIHVLRHAIDAAEIAAVRHRHAHIGDRAAERIDQRRLGRGGMTAFIGANIATPMRERKASAAADKQRTRRDFSG